MRVLFARFVFWLLEPLINRIIHRINHPHYVPGL